MRLKFEILRFSKKVLAFHVFPKNIQHFNILTDFENFMIQKTFSRYFPNFKIFMKFKFLKFSKL